MRTTVKVDRRTIVGRDASAFRASLVRHVGGAPSPTQHALIELSVQHRMRLVMMDMRFAEAGEMTEHDSRQYLAWANALARTLVKLGAEASRAAALSPHEALAAHFANKRPQDGRKPARAPSYRPQRQTGLSANPGGNARRSERRVPADADHAGAD